jgi:hypothetical protein
MKWPGPPSGRYEVRHDRHKDIAKFIAERMEKRDFPVNPSDIPGQRDALNEAVQIIEKDRWPD